MLERSAQDLYQRHRSGECTHEELQQAFRDLPGEWPDCPGADFEALMQHEIAVLRRRLSSNCSSRCSRCNETALGLASSHALLLPLQL